MVYFMDGVTAGTDSVVSALQTAITTDVMFQNLAKFIPVIGGVIICICLLYTSPSPRD